jgi:MYXO-CTERM domain-containing protein
MTKLGLVAALAVTLSAPHAADAFCGFYVAGGDQQMFNDATQVVLMRSGTRTVLSMQNNYKGPPGAFAMVVPVPTVLKEKDVKTLPKSVFENVERMGAPRLVEYWEQDPCAPDVDYDMVAKGAAAPPTATMERAKATDDLGVKIEAQFIVGEYQIVILSAKDSTGLDTWLRREKYNIPAGAEPLLRPYVEGGMKFFVAKVDPTKVKFVDGRAELSPLRFHYDTEQFALPIRLGLANSSGKQDLIVNILAPGQRYQVANYKNVTIPTNIDVKDSVKAKFGAFYTALFDATVEKNPGAVVTEYAWQATTCDPCPGPALDMNDFVLLGSDVLTNRDMNFVLTRLHARYGKDIQNDLEFKAAEPIVGGREFVVDHKTGKLEESSQPSSTNNFQGRYAIRHEWTGAVACQNPIRKRWGGPPGSGRNSQPPPPTPGLDLAFAPRGEVKLPEAVRQNIPELGITAAAASTIAAPNPPPPATTPPAKESKKSGCGCQSNDASGGLVLLLALLLGPAARRRCRRVK